MSTTQADIEVLREKLYAIRGETRQAKKRLVPTGGPECVELEAARAALRRLRVNRGQASVLQ